MTETHAITILHEMNQEIENLWFQGDTLGTAMQLPPLRIKCMIRKKKSHLFRPGSWKPVGE